VALAGLGAAGCGGGSKAPSVASLASPTSTSTAAGNAGSVTPSRPAFAACLTSHGFPAAVGSAGSAATQVAVFGVALSGNVDPASPRFQAALQACRKYLPGGGPPSLTPAQQAEAAKAEASFAACMRKHGVPNFPDPNGNGRFPLASLERLNSSSPRFKTAFKTCRSLQPKVGPRLAFS